MKLLELELDNICLHEKRVITFQDGLIGLFGPQGSGKSTLLSAAYAALTNDFSRIVGGKEASVRQQADEGEVSQIRLRAQCDAGIFTITRRLRPSMTHKLEFANKTYTKATEIQEILHDIIGTNKTGLDKYVFVNQWELRSLFNETPAERAKILMYLCGTGVAEKCWQSLGKQFEADSILTATMYDRTDELHKQLRVEQHATKSLQKTLLQMQAELLPDTQIETFREQIYLCTVRKEALVKQKELSADVLEKTQVVAEAEQELQVELATLENLKEQVAKLKVTSDAVREEVTKFQYAQAEWRKFLTLQDKFKVVQKKLAGLKAPQYTGKPAEAIEKRLQNLLLQKEQCLSVIEHFDIFQDQTTDSADCPTCGQQVDLLSVHNKVDEAKDKLETVCADEIRARTHKKKWLEFTSLMTTYTEDSSRLKIQLDGLTVQLVDIIVRQEPATPDLALIQVYDDISLTYETQNRVVNSLQLQIRTFSTELMSSKKQLVEIANKLKKLPPITDVTEIRDKIKQQEVTKEKVTETKTLLGKSQELSLELQEALQNAEELQKQQKRAQKWCHLLSSARDIFHRDNLPRLVHQHKLAAMEDGINTMLQQFESPFAVTTSDDLSYTARFRNGTIISAQGLSGGQQVILALAFRWVLNSIFANQTGLLILDEPTAGLDRRHVDLLETVFGQLGQVAKEQGCQVIIVTHEQSLESVFDQTIKLDRAVL